MTPLRQRMLEELQLRNLSEATIRTYLRLVERFAKHFGMSPTQLGPDHVRRYLLHLLNDKKDTWGTVQVNRGALKFLYVRVLKQPWFDEEIAAPKRRPRLPTVMNPEEITRILDRTTNLKHWTIIATFYATALRCNELRHLKVSDIDSQKMVLHVREGKGSVPRDIALSPALLERLRIYYRGCKPTDWLFPSKQHRDQPLMTIRSVRYAAMQAAEPVSNMGCTRTCFGTPAPRTCSMPAPISAPSRFYWATRIFEPPPSICAYPCNVSMLPAVPSMHSN